MKKWSVSGSAFQLHMRNTLKVVVSTSLVVLALSYSSLAGAAPASLPVGDETYIVLEGDTLDGIAYRYRVSVEAIVAANNLSNPDSLSVGQRLTIPTNGTSFAAANALSGGDGSKMMLPSDAKVSTQYGERGPYWRGGSHMGIDFAAPKGALVRAALGGLVVQSQLDDEHGYGEFIKIDHGNGLHTLYAHLSARLALVADKVDAGQQIGLVGNTGFAEGPHLHFEVRQDGQFQDPIPYLP